MNPVWLVIYVLIKGEDKSVLLHNIRHGSKSGPVPAVCIYMFIEVYIICDCKAVFVIGEARE